MFVNKTTCYPRLTHVPASGYLFVFGAIAAAAWLFFAASFGWYAMAAYSTLSSSLTGFGGAEGFFGLISTLAYTSPSGCYMWMEGGEKRERIREVGGREREWAKERGGWGGCDNEKEGYLLSNLSLENNLLTFRLNVPVVIRAKVTTGAFNQNTSKLLSESWYVKDNLSLHLCRI